MPESRPFRSQIATDIYEGVAYADSPLHLPTTWRGYAIPDNYDQTVLGLHEACQQAPSMPQDRSDEPLVNLGATFSHGWHEWQTVRDDAAPRPEPVFQLQEIDGSLLIRQSSSGRALALPTTGGYHTPVPGPILGLSIDGETWLRDPDSTLHGVEAAVIETRIESIGHIFVQWCVEYQLASGGRWRQRCRWMRDDDVIEIADEVDGDLGTAAFWRWTPCGEELESTAWKGGGGERCGPMTFVGYPEDPLTGEDAPERPVAVIGHISYHNQWRQGWVTFRPNSGGEGTPEISVFGGWGSLWERRGHQGLRVRLLKEPFRSLLEAPITSGRRLYGLVLHDGSQDGVFRTRFCHANQAKLSHADLAIGKTSHWVLEPPELQPVGELRLAPPAWLADLSAVTGEDDRVTRLLHAYLFDGADNRNANMDIAAAFALGKDGVAGERVEDLVEWAEDWFAAAWNGGYEGIIIFQGRAAKSVIYSLDALRARGQIEDDEYWRISRGLLLLAYVFSDPDYCRYGDFWAADEPESGVAEALAPEMGDCPVPPNFASEYFSTVGLVAELFPDHPMAAEWRRWACEQCDRFLAVYFAPDGTYVESINYHSHGILELATWFQALRHNGGRDYFAHPAVVGTYRMFTQLAMPPLTDGLPADRFLADPDLPARLCYPANGNSGKNGQHQPVRPDVLLAARVYADTDPVLAGQLMRLWRLAGRPLLEAYAPLLNLMAWDPDIPEQPLPTESVHRDGLGVVSRATLPSGDPVYLLIRAGAATHHMDFDQGHLQLTAGDREFLADHGYHTTDNDGHHIHAAATWLHSTVTYGAEARFSSGYTGLEEAPAPEHIELTPHYDLVMHRIVNTNYRDLDRIAYNIPIPCRTTIHYRYVLFAKPYHILVWDSFESVDDRPVFRLCTRQKLDDQLCSHPVGDYPRLRVKSLLETGVHIGQVGPLFYAESHAPATGVREFIHVLTIEDSDFPPDYRYDRDARLVTFPRLRVRLPPRHRPGAMPLIELV